MERNDTSSESDEQMKKRFGFEVSRDHSKEDDDDEEDEEHSSKKRQQKAPSKSLFFGGRESKEGKAEQQESDLGQWEREAKENEQRRTLLKMILGQDQAAEKQTKESEMMSDDEIDHAADIMDEESDERSEITESQTKEGSDEMITADGENEGYRAEETERLEAELQEIVEDKIEKIQSEMEGQPEIEDQQPHDARAAELAADMGFLEKVSEKIKNGTEAPIAIEESVVESLSEIESEENDSDIEFSPDGSEAEDLEPLLETSEDDTESVAASSATVPSTSGATAHSTPLTAAGAGAAAGSAASAASSRSGPPASGSSSSATRSSTPASTASSMPTMPPITPPLTGPGNPNVPSYPSFNPNILNAPAPPDTETVRVNDVYRRNRNTGKLILAGLVGYALGRRGGRKRTEARLQPEIDKRQKQVKVLEQKLDFNEQAVRQKAAETTRLRDELSERVQQRAAAETGQQRAEERLRSQEDMARLSAAESAVTTPLSRESLTPLQAQILSEQNTRTPSEVLAEAITPPRSETNLGKELLLAPIFAAAAAEAFTGDKLSESLKQQENAVLQADSDPALTSASIASPEAAEVLTPAMTAAPNVNTPRQDFEQLRQQAHNQERQRPIERPMVEAAKSADVQAMTMPELLSVAEKIDVGSGNLKDMYEHKRIDAVNLRRVVAEYAAGKNFKETLQRSLEAEEMHRELRNEVKTDDTAAASSLGSNSQSSSASPAQNQSSNSRQSNPNEDDIGAERSNQSRPLDMPPPSTSFMPELAREAYAELYREDDDEGVSSVSSAVVIAVGVAAGAVVAGILLFILNIV